MKLLITHNGDADWNVWATLDNHDALKDACGFVIGGGETKDAALASAVVELETAVDALQSPSGVVEEREDFV